MLKEINGDNKILRQKSAPFTDFSDEENSSEFISELQEKLETSNFSALCAVQFGNPVRVTCIKEPFNEKNILTFINPHIVSQSDETTPVVEGSINFKGVNVKVERPDMVRVRFQNLNGDTETKKFDGNLGRLIQIMIDTMDGKLPWERANYYHRNKAIKDWNIMKRRIKDYADV